MSERIMYMAIDAHARNCVLGCMDALGEFRQSWRFRTCEQELIRHVRGVEVGMKLLAIEEGTLTQWIAQTVRPFVTSVFIADPRKNPSISQNAMKGDKVDVRQLCRLLRLDELKRVYHPEDDQRAVFKAAVQHYLDLRGQQTVLKRKLKAKFRAWGVQEIEGTHVYNPKKRDAFLGRVKQAAVRHQLGRLYMLLDATVQMQRLALQEAASCGGEYPEIKQFQKIPGVGEVGALVFDAYIQTPHRFTRKSALYRYCRLGITDRSSDNKPLGYKRLDKEGNSELKAMSYRAFLCAMRIRRENEVRTFFNRSYKLTRNAAHARLNAQRKIISVMHGIWRKGEEYKPELFLGSE